MGTRATTLFLLVLATAACGRADRSQGVAAEAPAPPAEETERLASLGYVAARAPAATPASMPSLSSAPSIPSRRIQTASLRVEVADLEGAQGRLASLVATLGGYVQDSRTTGEEGHRISSLVLRIPAERFDDAVEAAEGLGKVLEAGTQTEDVSQAYADLEMRLRVKRGVEARLRDILEHRTGKLADVLEVERELARVVEEIEGMEAALASYDRQIAWSTIKADLHEAAPIVQAGFLGGVREAFRKGLATLATAATGAVYFVTFLVPWLVLASLGFFLVLRVRGRSPRATAR